jgi:hypothetical protein
MSVFEAVERDLERLAEGAGDSALGQTALALARELDQDNSATSKSMCAKSMIDVLRELRSLAPPEKESDGLDDLAARRATRLAGRSAAADSARP